MENSQQGSDGSRKEMDSVSGWGKAQDGDNARLRKRRKNGYFERQRGLGTRKKSEKKKTLRHLAMKYLHEIKQYAEWCKHDREYSLRMIEKYGVNWKTRKYRGGLMWHWRRSDWCKKQIQKLRQQIIKAGGDPNCRRLKEKY
jgi:hypothetical protein